MYQNFVPFPSSPCSPFPFGDRCFMPQQHYQMSLARAYVMDQPYTGIFPINEAMYRGTVFPNLAAAFPGPIGQFDNRRI